jgi:ribonuclease HI
VDVAFNIEDRTGATGPILGEYHGVFLAASSRYLPRISSSTMAESYAMRDGLELANVMGCTSNEAKSDSLEVIEYCSGNKQLWNKETAIFADCLSIIDQIGKVEFTHCRRSYNRAAHAIARSSFIDKSSCIWVDEPLVS